MKFLLLFASIFVVSESFANYRTIEEQELAAICWEINKQRSDHPVPTPSPIKKKYIHDNKSTDKSPSTRHNC
jgi:hypothetical protein